VQLLSVLYILTFNTEALKKDKQLAAARSDLSNLQMELVALRSELRKRDLQDSIEKKMAQQKILSEARAPTVGPQQQVSQHSPIQHLPDAVGRLQALAHQMAKRLDVCVIIS